MQIDLTKEEAKEAYLAFSQRARSSGSGTRQHDVCKRLAGKLEQFVLRCEYELQERTKSNGHHEDN